MSEATEPERMELTRGTAYGLGLSQCAITLGVVLFSPPVHVDVFVARPLVNASAPGGFSIDPRSQMQGMRVFMGMPLLLASALAAVFSTVTYQAHEQGLSGQDYQHDVLEQLGMWDLLFWAYCMLAHGLVVCLVADPVDVFGCVASTAFMVYFLYRACSPKSQCINLTQENLNILGYCLGILQLAYQITDTRPNGSTVVMVVLVMDYFLGIGHTYDRQATIDTVTNCRLFYICGGTVGTAALYGMCTMDGGLAWL